MISTCEKNFYRVINCSEALLNVKYTSINITQVHFWPATKVNRSEARFIQLSLGPNKAQAY